MVTLNRQGEDVVIYARGKYVATTKARAGGESNKKRNLCEWIASMTFIQCCSE